jgi:hypothetical protein
MKLNQLLNQLRQPYQRVKQWLQQHKEQTVENNQQEIIYTEEQLMARLKFFIGICLSLTLFGIVFVVLYSLIFVTQPLNAISPIDQKFFELIVPIATFLTGTLSGIMLAGNNPEAQQKALEAANKGWDRPPSPTPPNGGSNGNATFGSSTSTNAGGFGPSTTSGSFGTTSSSAGFGTTGTFGSTGFGTPAVATFEPQVTTGFGGKPAPAQPPHPEI